MLRTGAGAAQRPAGRLWRVRLAFAVAAHPSTRSGQRLEPEILLVDEVLAVGTQRFRRNADRDTIWMYSRSARRQIHAPQNLADQQEINNMERPEHSMTMTPTTPFDAALDVIDRLPPDDQEAIIEIVRRRIIERRRREIADNAQATLLAFREGRASYGTVDDLRRELEA